MESRLGTVKLQEVAQAHAQLRKAILTLVEAVLISEVSKWKFVRGQLLDLFGNEGPFAKILDEEKGMDRYGSGDKAAR